ncbi:phycobilisome rod-core linker polypeptide [Leptolyngbya cf. ectocarpi LEGE 11479]|uniref:Phycobilisome rod-core linker polypeptide n=1 Tax=Leptolyngbya cf. ectocarpi LEGE 11479 TaxID=1828722 RepID=A0A928X2H6_LEPEC|nr:phycobilisome rod-core linker polypeptide [Leptolyngbya ectocarpi]MBE9066349.1 phycobilisome rod-core linker polypeptide [Leptolyngbya cf. ectocarpi LEGE 11479]
MVSTFANPVASSAIRLGTQAFDETDPVQLWPSDSLGTVEIVIRAVYKQVLGNAHVMESERAAVAEAESQLQNRTITVRDFIRQIAKSELYRSRFFEPCSRNRFIEINFKHLLGRAPDSYGDIADHSYLLESEGYESEIDSYLDSDEYQQAFGDDTVPYYRGHKSPTGQKVSGFANLLKLLRGAASNDNNLGHDQQARLTQAIMANRIDAISPLSRLPDLQTGFKHAPQVLHQQQVEPTLEQRIAQNTYQGYEPFRQTSPVELLPGASADDIEVVIRAVYRQVMGNAHVMESERLVVPESQLKRGELSVREFVRQVAKSELYRSRFADNCYRYRAMELNFKHLLGRAPQTFAEMKAHSTILDTEGYEADIDSYINSDEYNNAFGESIVPYYRGYRTEPGQTMLEFTNMLQLLKSASSSDKDPATNNAPRVQAPVLSSYSKKSSTPRDAQEILAEVFRPKPGVVVAAEASVVPAAPVSTSQPNKQDALIAKLQEQLADLRPFAGIGAAIIRKGSEPRTVITAGTSQFTLQQQTDDKAALIERLQGELMEARALAAVGESRLNKWRR